MKCNCDSGKAYSECCQPFLKGTAYPQTPEALMRSRYTAYAHGNMDYIEKTMISPASDGFDANAAKAWSMQAKWLKLEVVNSSVEADKGFVEFIAHFSMHHKRQMIHEKSEFHCIDGKWFYVKGDRPER